MFVIVYSVPNLWREAFLVKNVGVAGWSRSQKYSYTFEPLDKNVYSHVLLEWSCSSK